MDAKLEAEIRELVAAGVAAAARFERDLYNVGSRNIVPLVRALASRHKTGGIELCTLTEFGQGRYVRHVIGTVDDVACGGGVVLGKLFVPEGMCGGVLRGDFAAGDLAAAVAVVDAHARDVYLSMVGEGEKKFRNNAAACEGEAARQARGADEHRARRPSLVASIEAAEAEFARAEDELAAAGSAAAAGDRSLIAAAARRYGTASWKLNRIRDPVEDHDRRAARYEEQRLDAARAAAFNNELADEIRDNVPLAERASFRDFAAVYRWALAAGILAVVRIARAGDDESLARFITARDVHRADPAEFLRRVGEWGDALEEWTPVFGSFLGPAPPYRRPPTAEHRRREELEAQIADLHARIAELRGDSV